MSENKDEKQDAGKYLKKYTPKDSSINVGDESISGNDLAHSSGIPPLEKDVLKKGEGKWKVLQSAEEKQIQQKKAEFTDLYLDTHLSTLREQCVAAVKESKAFWDGKSEEVAKRIHAYVASSINDIEADRVEHLNSVIERITRTANDSIADAMNSEDLIEQIKEKRIQIIFEEMEASIKRVQEENAKRR